MKRTDGLKAYIAGMRNMMDTLSTDKVYTLCFWGVSQFVDANQWQVKGILPGMKIDANKFGGKPPLFVVAYALDDKEAENGEQKRHYKSKKSYLFKVALWSQLKPPEPEYLANLLNTDVVAAETSQAPRRQPRFKPFCGSGSPSALSSKGMFVTAAQRVL